MPEDQIQRLRSASVTFGIEPAWLKAELDKPGRSQSALARFMGTAPCVVNKMCGGAGGRDITARESDQIRAYLAVTVNQGVSATGTACEPSLDLALADLLQERERMIAALQAVGKTISEMSDPPKPIQFLRIVVERALP